MQVTRLLRALSLALFLFSLGTASYADETGGDNPSPPVPSESTADNSVPSSPGWESETEQWQYVANTIWVLLAAFLVFWMNAGFGCVEAGFCRSKNAVNILGKNFVVFGLSTLIFWAVGFAIMFGDGNSLMGTTGWFAAGADNSPHNAGYEGVYSSLSWAALPLNVKFFFQLAFAATAATIVSGCVAERIHYQSYMLFVVVLVGISYPITGHWIWGAGWLQNDYKFFDFAGSTAVHSVGGWAGLIGIILLGSRRGKYQTDGSIRPIPGHNMGLAFLGGLILWMGWFGFNPGSFMAADAEGIAFTVVTTNTAAAAGLISATSVAWIKTGKPDFSMTVNGALAGLVAITAGCSVISVPMAAVVGAIGGVLAVFAVLMFDRLKLDDPVGALSVHLVNGIWGTLAVGLFADTSLSSAGSALAGNGLFTGGGMTQLTAQVIGILSVGLFTVVISLIGWLAVKAVFGLRVSPDVEQMGLDRTEMGMEAYPENVLR
ncbi:MAG: ammonium transporter [Planctomycetaceae bacterium]|nr:ammonium transporter [Planctomycetaceae bacterium]